METLAGRRAVRAAAPARSDHARGDHARRLRRPRRAARFARCAAADRRLRRRAATRCCCRRSCAATSAAEPVGALPPRARRRSTSSSTRRSRCAAPSRTPTERDDVLSLLLGARARGRRADERRASCATSWSRCSAPGTRRPRPALAWAFERLLRNPTVLERLRESSPRARTTTWTPSSRRRCASRPVIVDVARKLTAPLRIGGYELPAGTLVAAGDRRPALRARTSIPTRASSGPSASSTAAPRPTPGSRSAAACAAASARPSPRTRCGSCCARSRARRPAPHRSRAGAPAHAQRHRRPGARGSGRDAAPVAGSGKPAALSGKPPMARSPSAGGMPPCPKSSSNTQALPRAWS